MLMVLTIITCYGGGGGQNPWEDLILLEKSPVLKNTDVNMKKGRKERKHREKEKKKERYREKER